LRVLRHRVERDEANEDPRARDLAVAVIDAACGPASHARYEGLLIIGRSLVVTGHELRVHDLETGRVRWSF